MIALIESPHPALAEKHPGHSDQQQSEIGRSCTIPMTAANICQELPRARSSKRPCAGKSPSTVSKEAPLNRFRPTHRRTV
jgi:hypothetical protein